MSEFDKAVKHVKTCLFWDFVDGQWLEKLYTPLDRDFFNRLMQGVVEAHEAENAKLRELAKYAILCSEGDIRCEACPYHDKTREPHIICTMRKAAIELGIEVPK